MPKLDPGSLIYDGFSTLNLGMNNGTAGMLLPVDQAQLLVNATSRGGYAMQRPGLRRIMTALITPPGSFQHFGDFRTDAGQQFLIVVAGGRFYRLDPAAKDSLEITPLKNGVLDPNPSVLERGWSVQGETFWIYNDGLTAPLIFNGGSARRATPNEIKPGTVIAYVQGRLWYALPDGFSFRATDLVGNTDSGTPAYGYRDSILHETENDYLNEGGDFRVPFASGEITAMAATSILDTSQGQGPLQVLGQRNGFSVNTPVDRTTWKNLRYPIQTESLIGAGCSGAQSTVNVNGDLFFRSPDGIRSFIVARRQFRDWGNTPQSWEMSGLLGFDQPDLLTFGSGAVWDNRYLTTLSPAWSNRGVFHRGLAVVDLAPITSVQQPVSPPVYDGLWTGLNILAIRQTVDGVFILALEEGGVFGLWKLTNDEKLDNQETRIQWTVIPRSLFVERDSGGRVQRNLKRLETAELEYDQLSGTVDFRMSWLPDSYPCPTEWAHWSECVQQCFTNIPCSGPLQFNTGYQPRKRLPEPPDVCSAGATRPLRNFYVVNPRLDITGPARLLSVRLGASRQPEPKYEANTCEPVECVSLQCCDYDLWGYNAFPGGITPYSGSSGSGGSGGGVTPPDGGGGGGGGGQPVLPNKKPVWPIPEPLCDGAQAWGPCEVTDPLNPGHTGRVGINFLGYATPEDYLAAFCPPGGSDACIEAWAQETWNQFLAHWGNSWTQARIEWSFGSISGDAFFAQQVFPDQPGGYALAGGSLNTYIVVVFCT